MPCHLLLGKLAAVAPAHVVGALEDLVPPLTATLTARPKPDAVKQEVRLPARCPALSEFAGDPAGWVLVHRSNS